MPRRRWRLFTGWQARRWTIEARFASLAEAALRGAKLAGQDAEVTRWASEVAAGAANPTHRAALLGRAAKVLAEVGRREEALMIVRQALVAARQAGRESVLEVIAAGAHAIAALDGGKTAREVLYAMLDIEGFWEPPNCPSGEDFTRNALFGRSR